MNYTQNNKITQVKEITLIVGVDEGSENNYARCFDFRCLEYSEKAFKFSNTAFGYGAFEAWILEHKSRTEKVDVIVGMEGAGHYWFNFGEYLKNNEINLVLVNPHHVKKSKELDDNLQSKNDLKDPKVIAGLVKDGRYQEPYIQEGIFANLRILSNIRFDISKDLIRLSNKIQKWISVYFPEYKKIYSRFDAKSSLILLKEAALPEDITSLGADKINQLWRKEKLRAVGVKTVAGFLAEVGDIRRFSNPKQIQKYADFAIVSNESGKYKGSSSISRRGRKRLRYVLFEVALSLIGKNREC